MTADRMSGDFDSHDRQAMTRALDQAQSVRCITSPNPWVGAVIVPTDDKFVLGATEEAGGAHAEIVALRKAGRAAEGSTMYVTLEPCAHHGRTPPCAEAIIAAGVRRVVIGLADPDPLVDGRGIEMLRAGGVEVDVGLFADRVSAQLAPYIMHRATGLPWVVLKLASTLDGGTAAPDGSSQWITSPEARADGHRLRAEADAIIIGAGTVRRDDPSLTVRDYRPPVMAQRGDVDPLRVVLGTAPEDARVHPCRQMDGDLHNILTALAADGVMSVLVEGGAAVAGAFHRAALVDRYVIYVAPALFGGDDARSLFTGPGAYSIDNVARGRFTDIQRIGDDVRIEMAPAASRDGEV